MSIEKESKATATTMMVQNHHQQQHPNKPSSFAAVGFRVAGGLLILTCLFASLANPYPAHPKATIKQKHAGHSHHHHANNHHHTKVRREKVQYEPMVLVNSVQHHNSTSTKRTYDPIDLHLPRFPTLQAELDTAEVVVLYFGARWCPQSKAVTTMIDQIIQPKLKALGSTTTSTGKRPLSVIYVSSDANKGQFREMNRNRYWAKVPFQPSTERRLLKQYFKVCAKREMEKLQMQRKYEIPTLLVLSGKTHKVVSRKGVEDLKRLGPGVLDYWTKLVRGNVAIIPK